MVKITRETVLLYRSQGRPGKIEVVPARPYSTQISLSLAYSPGVTEPCLEMEKNPQDIYKYAAKDNLVAVISSDTAVLGLGNIGALSSKSVMEGKGLFFKTYAGISVFDIEVSEESSDKFIEVVKVIAPTFGSINLEDIKVPECFEIECRLKEEFDIPAICNDQRGTAIISSVGLVNALQVADKRIEDVEIVVNGAGTSTILCTKFYVSLGARLENIIMLDSRSIISKARIGLNEQKRYFATDRTDIHILAEAVKGTDVFLGLSKENVLSQDVVRSMVSSPIMLVLANSTPGISYEDVMATHPDVLMATGRPDYPNQINNVIGFPYIFRGALDTQVETTNEEMKIATIRATANLTKQPVPGVMNEAYHVNNLTLGPEYFISKSVDPRPITEVSIAVARVVMESDVAHKNTENWDEYKMHLRGLMGQKSQLIRQLYGTTRHNPQRVVFVEGGHPNMLKAIVEAKPEGICHPIISGNEERTEKLVRELDLSLDGIEIINLCHDREAEQREHYAHVLSQKHAHKGATYEEVNGKMLERSCFDMMMVKTGDADTFITGLYTKYSNITRVAKEATGICLEYKHLGTMYILSSKKGTHFLVNTLINRHPDTSTPIDMVKLANQTVRFFNHTPVISMLSHSNFGSGQAGGSLKVHEAIVYIQKEYPELAIDGEAQMNFIMNRELHDSKYPSTRLNGEDMNTLIFPSLSSTNAGYQLLQVIGPDAESIGPIQMGLNKPIHLIDIGSSVHNIVNVITMAVIDTIVEKRKANK